jgi:transcriptional regulator with XRE-family HTH domain
MWLNSVERASQAARTARRDHRMTIGRLSRKSGVPKSFIKALENGDPEPSVENAFKLFHTLNIEPTAIPHALMWKVK